VRGPADSVDGVGDYCAHLAGALAERGHQVSVTSLDWHLSGRLGAIRTLLSRGGASPTWTVLQHTHLSWSRRGFPLFAVLIALVLKRRTRRLAVVIHDPLPFGGSRVRDRFRRNTQISVMRLLTWNCDVAMVTVPLQVIPWLRRWSRHVEYVPIGSNINRPPGAARGEPGLFEVVVFGVSMTRRRELIQIAEVSRWLADAIGRFRLSVVGQGSDQAAVVLRDLLVGRHDIELQTTGVLSEAEVGSRLARANAALFVRDGGISSRRGSALAALAAGLPVVGYMGPETASPLSEAGVVLTRPDDSAAAASALAQIAHNADFAQELRQSSIHCYRRYFAWPAVAEQMERALEKTEERASSSPVMGRG
jgi:glycosyltransferase involved in cell wall biosynthesis